MPGWGLPVKDVSAKVAGKVSGRLNDAAETGAVPEPFPLSCARCFRRFGNAAVRWG
jgi:hypothetical protein